MALTDLLPSSAGQGFSVLFDAAQFALTRVRGPTRVQLDSFHVECTLSEDITYEAEVTEFEVEKGANISDHRRQKPVEVSIAGLVSDTPLDSDLVAAAVALAANSLGIGLNLPEPATGQLAGDAVLTGDAFHKLVDLYEVGSRASPTPDGTFTIVTKYRTFPNMVVKSLRFRRETGTGTALPFFATFREIRTVETSTTLLTSPAMLQDTNPLGQKGGGDEAPAAMKARTKSIAVDITDGGGLTVAPSAGDPYFAWLKAQGAKGGK